MGTVGTSVEKLAEEFAKEAMADPEFRASIREIAHDIGVALRKSIDFERQERERREERRLRRRKHKKSR